MADFRADELRAIIAFADGPPPVLALASEDEVREMIAFLAGALKAPRTSLEGGKIKLGAYRLVLSGQPKAALMHAVQTAIRTLEWLPTPAELLKLAEAYTAPERFAHAIATRIARDHRHNRLEETLRKCRDRKLSDEELIALPDPIAKIAETRGHLLIWRDGKRTYRNAETLAAMLASMDDWGERITHERTKRASEAVERADAEALVGDLAAGLMAGMEVSDGED